MKKVLISVIALAVVLSLASYARAESPRPHRPDVMSASPDVLNAVWETGVSEDGGAKGQSIEMTDFAYYSFRNWWDQDLADITKVRASFMDTDTTVNFGGSPRFSLELDVEPDADLDDDDVMVYLDPAHCSDLAQSGWMQADFTGDRTNCTIYDSTTASYVSDADGTAWSKLVAAYPEAKVWFMYLIQDASIGTNYVDRIMLDNAFFTKQP